MVADQSRRAFLARLTGAASVGAASLTVPGAEARVAAGGLQTPQPTSARWDTAWLDTFKGRHKQVWDLLWHTLRPGTLNPPMNYLDTHK